MINAESNQNCTALSLTRELALQITIDDLLVFLTRVKSNRQKQLISCGLSIDLVYYLWFDEMAGQLRFSFINSNHKALPFKCDLTLIKTEKEIIDRYLKSDYLDGVPWKDLMDLGIDGDPVISDETEKIYTLNIYVEKITRNK